MSKETAFCPATENGPRSGMNHDEQIEVAAYLAYELYEAMETWEDFGISWNKMGRLLDKAHGHYGTLKELIHKEFGA
jgi:hypothetical protein